MYKAYFRALYTYKGQYIALLMKRDPDHRQESSFMVYLEKKEDVMLYGPGVRDGVITDDGPSWVSEAEVRRIAAQAARNAISEYEGQMIRENPEILKKMLAGWDPVKDMEEMTGLSLR